jgi:hypothetical protein
MGTITVMVMVTITMAIITTMIDSRISPRPIGGEG